MPSVAGRVRCHRLRRPRYPSGRRTRPFRLPCVTPAPGRPAGLRRLVAQAATPWQAERLSAGVSSPRSCAPCAPGQPWPQRAVSRARVLALRTGLLRCARARQPGPRSRAPGHGSGVGGKRTVADDRALAYLLLLERAGISRVRASDTHRPASAALVGSLVPTDGGDARRGADTHRPGCGHGRAGRAGRRADRSVGTQATRRSPSSPAASSAQAGQTSCSAWQSSQYTRRVAPGKFTQPQNAHSRSMARLLCSGMAARPARAGGGAVVCSRRSASAVRGASAAHQCHVRRCGRGHCRTGRSPSVT